MNFPWKKKTEIETEESTFNTRIGPIPIELISRADALQEWQRRVAEFPTTGKWPLLVGPESELEELVRVDDLDEEFEMSPEEVLEEAQSVDLREFFEERLSQLADPEDEEDEGPDLEVAVTELDRTKPGPRNLVVIDGMSDEPPARVGLVEIPCEQPWQVLTIRPFGNWNEVPSDAESTAVLKSWYERYGAVPVGLTFDVLQLWLAQPIADPQAAADLAKEMYGFCPDVVDQGVGSIQALAQEILNAHAWFFWWD